MTLCDLIPMLSEGQIIRRAGWNQTKFSLLFKGIKHFAYIDGSDVSGKIGLTPEDVCAKDWYLCERLTVQDEIKDNVIYNSPSGAFIRNNGMWYASSGVPALPLYKVSDI